MRYLAPPLLLLSYGIARLLDGRDGSHGPGPAWTIGHVLFLASLVTFGVALVGLDRIAAVGGRARLVAGVTLGLSFVGLAGFVWTVLLDLWVGLNAADRAGMNRLYERHETPALVTMVAPLFQVGLLVLLIQLATARRGPWWSPVCVLVGSVAITVSLDLLPVGALFFLAALVPFALSNRSAPPNQRVSVTTRSTPSVLG